MIEPSDADANSTADDAAVAEESESETPSSPVELVERIRGEILTIVFTPVVGLVGAVTGFYYGQDEAGRR